MFKFKPYESYMMPAHFGPLPQGEKPSGWYRDVTMMVVPYLTDREKLAAHLPHPFTVGEQPVVTVVYCCSKDVDWLAGRGYNLVAVTASAVFNGENEQLEGQYSLVWWENLADAILSGRERTGIPKIFGDIPDHSVVDDQWHTSVSHFGSKILDMSIKNLRVPTPQEVETAQKATEGKDHPMAWRYLPEVGGFGPALSEPTTFPSDSLYTGAWVGEGKVDWNHLTWEQNPTQCHIANALADLPVLGYLPAMVTTGSTNLFVPDRLPRVLDKKETIPANIAEETTSKTIEEIKTVCFVGAGTMGCSNALVAAISGYNVELYDISEETLKQVPNRFKEFAPFLIGGGYCTPAQLGAAFPRISAGTDLAKAMANADLVSESVFESEELKREIHQKLDEICPDRTILTTNTSSLLVSQIEDVVERGDRFAALHFYMGSRLVDIVAGPRTTPETIDILKRYAESLELVPLVLKKEHPGYIMNVLLHSMLLTADALVIEGIASREDVDRAYMANLKTPMGPFGIMDMIGLDLIFSQLDKKSPDTLQARVADYFKPYVKRGEFGMKTGKGFYSYPAPAYQQADFLTSKSPDKAVYHAMVVALIRSAVLIALQEVADPEDIDRTWTIATGQELGPFGLLKTIGTETILDVSSNTEDSLKLLSDEENDLVEAYIRQIQADC
ncbi:3-hydroxyacyl-CoA dehydrogenase NAD-binding domain-containing protein [Pseudomonadota bacterium]